MTELPQLSIEYCRNRQRRLREAMKQLGVERAIFVTAENVQWLTGFRHHRLMRAVAIMDMDECMLIAPNSEPAHHAADTVHTFEAQWLSTLRQEQFRAAMELVPKSSAPTAIEFSAGGPELVQSCAAAIVDIDPAIWNLRRRKDPDELAMIRHAISCTDAMYREAREILRPGITELEVYSRLHAVAVATAGEPLTDLGNDYQSNARGGPPRNRAARAGELMILDLGPAFRGYYADNCRTFAVDGRPTQQQLEARAMIIKVFDLVKEFVRPGAACRELFWQAKALLDDYLPDAFPHHLGHGIGLYPHEAPHLNPNWDDPFEEGDVFTVEPGLYTETLQAGIRIEENYLVTADGVEQLTKTATEL